MENNIIPDAVRKITIIGESIRESVNDDELNNFLAKTSKIIQTYNYNMFATNDVKKIADYNDCSIEEVENNRKLVKTINDKINSI